jgi:hypothetical protein
MSKPSASGITLFIVCLIAFVVVAFFLTGCAQTVVYQPTVVNGKDGRQGVKAVKMLALQGDIAGAFTLRTRPGGYVELDVKPLDASQVLMQRIAVTDSKGNPLLTKDGQAIFNEVPLVAGLNHSFPTAARGDAISKALRSVGSVVGTVAASVTGASAANSLAGAIP